MSSWAIVIGIDDYKDNPLPGSTSDAQRACEWLTRDGGPVPPSNVYLCLSPLPASLPAAIANVGWMGDATMKTLVDVLAHLWRRSGDDVYVYFAGHGAFVPGQLLQQYERVLLASDWTPAGSTSSLKVVDLLDAFAGAGFTNQFFFLDACADVQAFRAGVIPNPPTRDYSRHVNQFVLHATSPGAMAAQVTPPGTPLARGVYTDALMAAVSGVGAAKRYDYKSRAYRVQWSDLARYVIARVKGQAILPSPKSATIQWPVEDGQHDDSNPVFATFPADHFAKVTLSVMVDPAGAGAEATLTVQEPGKLVPIKTFGPCSTLPVPFDLDPRLYFVAGSADGYAPVEESWSADLYEDAALTVAFTPGVGPPSPPPPPPPPSTEAPYSTRVYTQLPDHKRHLLTPDEHLTNNESILEAFASRSVTLGVKTDDPLAHLDIIDLDGHIVASGQGALASYDIEPGAYYVRYRSPEGAVASRLVNVVQGGRPRIQLAPPAIEESPAMSRIVAQKGFWVDPAGNLHVSEELGPIASGRLSTVLALAGVLATYPQGAVSFGHRLQAVGLAPLSTFIPATESTGIHVVFADELPRPSGLTLPLTAIAISLRPIRDGAPTPIALRPIGDANVIAQGGAAIRPGAHWLTVAVPGMLQVRFAIHLLKDRVTFLVFSRVASGDIGVFQYFLPTHPTPVDDPMLAARAVRALELVERRVLAGLFGDVTDPEGLVELERGDPMQVLFGGYLSLRARVADGSRAFDGASTAANWLIERYTDLPDGYVIRAGIAEAIDRPEEAGRDYAEALTRGLPVFVGGLARLSAAIERYDLAHPNGALVQQVVRERIPSSLWPVHAPS